MSKKIVEYDSDLLVHDITNKESTATLVGANLTVTVGDSTSTVDLSTLTPTLNYDQVTGAVLDNGSLTVTNEDGSTAVVDLSGVGANGESITCDVISSMPISPAEETDCFVVVRDGEECTKRPMHSLLRLGFVNVQPETGYLHTKEKSYIDIQFAPLINAPSQVDVVVTIPDDIVYDVPNIKVMDNDGGITFGYNNGILSIRDVTPSLDKVATVRVPIQSQESLTVKVYAELFVNDFTALDEEQIIFARNTSAEGTDECPVITAYFPGENAGGRQMHTVKALSNDYIDDMVKYHSYINNTTDKVVISTGNDDTNYNSITNLYVPDVTPNSDGSVDFSFTIKTDLAATCAIISAATSSSARGNIKSVVDGVEYTLPTTFSVIGHIEDGVTCTMSGNDINVHYTSNALYMGDVCSLSITLAMAISDVCEPQYVHMIIPIEKRNSNPVVYDNGTLIPCAKYPHASGISEVTDEQKSLIYNSLGNNLYFMYSNSNASVTYIDMHAGDSKVYHIVSTFTPTAMNSYSFEVDHINAALIRYENVGVELVKDSFIKHDLRDTVDENVVKIPTQANRRAWQEFDITVSVGASAKGGEEYPILDGVIVRIV